MDYELVSCIVPVYNGELYLMEAVGSVLKQTHPSVELIVVDDGSTDGTAELLERFGGELTYIYEPNCGPSVARNTGLKEAHGEYVAFLDADDVWIPEKLVMQLNRFRLRPDLDVCVGLVQNFWMPEVESEKELWAGSRPLGPLPGYICSTLMARRPVFDRVGGFNPTMMHGEDNEWFSRVMDGGVTVELVEEVLAYRRFHEENLMRRYRGPEHEEFLKLAKARLNRHRAGGDTPGFTGGLM